MFQQVVGCYKIGTPACSTLQVAANWNPLVTKPCHAAPSERSSMCHGNAGEEKKMKNHIKLNKYIHTLFGGKIMKNIYLQNHPIGSNSYFIGL
jgi:hypothetical protein